MNGLIHFVAWCLAVATVRVVLAVLCLAGAIESGSRRVEAVRVWLRRSSPKQGVWRVGSDRSVLPFVRVRVKGDRDSHDAGTARLDERASAVALASASAQVDVAENGLNGSMSWTVDPDDLRVVPYEVRR